MRVTIAIDDETAFRITKAAEEEGLTKEEWMVAACTKALDTGENTPAKIPEDYNKLHSSIKEKDNEILSLRKEINHQIELKETYSRFLEEKVQRIDDLKEEIARIESMSMTMTDQILLDRDERIKDLNKMIEHLQAQAAAHSVALQSAIKPALEGKVRKDDMEEIRETEDGNKPKRMRWFFRK